MSWNLTKRWTAMCGSRRDQELDSHEEMDNHVRVKARPRAGLSRKVGQSFSGLGEIKRREVS